MEPVTNKKHRCGKTSAEKSHKDRACILVLVFVIQAEPYTPGCAASESGVTSPELLIMFPYRYLERF